MTRPDPGRLAAALQKQLDEWQNGLVLDDAEALVIIDALNAAAAKDAAPMHPKLAEVLEEAGCTGTTGADE